MFCIFVGQQGQGLVLYGGLRGSGDLAKEPAKLACPGKHRNNPNQQKRRSGTPLATIAARRGLGRDAESAAVAIEALSTATPTRRQNRDGNGAHNGPGTAQRRGTHIERAFR